MNIFQTVFAKAANQWPDNIALCVEQKQFTYQTLLQLSLNWASQINDYNPAQAPIAIFGGKQWHMYAGILAILATKASYVPLSNEQPVNRTNSILAQLNCQVLLVAEGEDIDELLQQQQNKLTVIYLGADKPNWLSKLSLHTIITLDSQKKLSPRKQQSLQSNKDNPYAYIMFTSGSTGTPKGIAVSKKNLISHLKRLDEILHIKPYDRVSQFFALNFDLSVHDMFSCWQKGAALYVLPKQYTMYPSQFIKHNEITVFSAVASVLSFIDKLGKLTPNELPSLRLSCFGGEKLLTAQAAKWQACAPNSKVINLYGPTECTITASYYDFSAAALMPNSASVPIGKPLPGLITRLIKDDKLVNEKHTLAELYIAGDQVVDGYWQDSAKTAQAFVYLEDNIRYYRTGDIVYLNDNNELVFHGRSDFQFSINGYRVEAGEIESAILSFADVITWCTVKALNDPQTQQQQIIAFIETSKTLDTEQLKQFCQTKLPHYMLPDSFILTEKLPRNINGKVDIKALSLELNNSATLTKEDYHACISNRT